MVPLIVGDQARGMLVLTDTRARARVQQIRRAAAGDARQQHERRARERAAVRRDAAAAQGNRAAQRRARHHQQRAGTRSRPSSTSRASTMPSATRSVTSFTTRTCRIRIYDAGDQSHPLPVRLRERKAKRGRSAPAGRRDSRRTSFARARRSCSTRTSAERMAKYGSYVFRRDRARKVVDLGAAGGGRPGARAHQPRRTWSASTPSAIPTYVCCRRSPTR